MKERGILFSAPMVRAILAGTKTQTRRIVKPQPSQELLDEYAQIRRERGAQKSDAEMLSECLLCPYGVPGDRLWVRETWSARDGNAVLYKADNVARVFPRECYEAAELRSAYNRHMNDVRPSIHMPRWASRITLEITAVRVERLQDISEADAVAEGVSKGETTDGEGRYELGFSDAWEEVYGLGAWDANPWVWVIEFRRIAK